MLFNNDSIENFTATLKTFEKHGGYDVAQKLAAFLLEDKHNVLQQAESNTWKLLAILDGQNTKSRLYKLAALKEWVSKIRIGDDLLERVKQKVLDEEEIEEDIMQIVRKNRILQPHKEPPSKKAKLSEEGNKDSIHKDRWKQLRQGNYERVYCKKEDDPTAVYLYNEYIRFNLIAFEKDNSQYTDKEWATWYECVQSIAKNPSIGVYEKMLYNTLLGNTDSLTESVLCQTWEDIVWAYLNGFLTEELELSRTSTSAYSYKEAFNRANFKDCILEKGDPRIFFHKVQSFIIQNDIGGLIEELYKAFVLKNAYSDLYTRPECFPGALRFAATLVLYGRQYCEWIEDDKSTAIVAQFTEFNSQADFFKPLTVIVYTSKLSQADQLSVYSKFLEDFVGDDEEIAILVHLSKQHNINIKETLEKTSNRLTQKAIVQMNNAQKEQATETFLRALQWLTVDKKLCLKALNTSNYIIRYLLKTRYHLEIANTISKAIPQELEIVASNIPDPEYNLKEHKSHKRFLNAFWLKKDWDSLLENKPIDDGSLDMFIETLEWRRSFQEQTDILEREMKFLLESGWLGKEAIEMEHVTKSELLCEHIPELVIQYHQLLHLSSSVIPKNSKKSEELGTFINVKQRDLFHIIKEAKKMKEVVKELSKSFEGSHKE